IFNRALSPAEINASYNAGLYRLETNYTDLAEGTYTYTAYAQDITGNVNQTETRTLTVDTTPPTIIIFEPTNTTTNDNTPHVNATQTDANPIDSMWYSIDGGANIYGSWTDEIDTSTTTLSESTHYITIYANDTAGNQNQTTKYFEVDALAPVISINSPPTNFHGGDVWMNISLDQRVSWCGYSIDEAANVTMSNTTLTDYNKLAFGVSQGIQTVTFYCNNTFGLISSTSREFNNTEGFTIIKLTGTGFTPIQNNANKYVSTSFADGTTAGIIHADGVYDSMSSSTTHLELRQKTLIAGNMSKAYIVYTKGDTDTIKNRAPYIQNKQIEKMPNPSFAFGINKKYKIQISLEYTNINITGIPKFGKGYYEIQIENKGKLNQKPIVYIDKY
ncbi:hypothetical protein GQ473_06750, partial [archaeon]|nr:hypothetical protein [archaeon]